MENKNPLNSKALSNVACAAVLHENLEIFLSAANKKVLELSKENEMLRDKVKHLKSTEVKCDKCSDTYLALPHLLQPNYVKMKKQPYVIEMKFPNTEAVFNYIKASPNLEITNINKFLDKYSLTISQYGNI